MAENIYVDSSMNKQNWNRWRNRYSKYIKTIEDADVAINSMLLSLNDNYTKFLRSDLFVKQKLILDSKITGIGILFNTIETAKKCFEVIYGNDIANKIKSNKIEHKIIIFKYTKSL